MVRGYPLAVYLLCYQRMGLKVIELKWNELYNKVCEDLKAKTNGKTAENYIRDLDACDFTEKPTRDAIDRLIAEWNARGLSNNTMRRRFAAIKWVFNHYPREFDPADVQEAKNEMKLKGEVPDMVYATKEQVEKILPLCDQRTALSVGMMFYAGMRTSEVARCKLSHWQEQEDALTILIPDRDELDGVRSKTKNSHARRVVVMPTLRKLFESYVAEDRKRVEAELNRQTSKRLTTQGNYDPDGLFLGYKGNLTDKGIRKYVKEACVKAGYPELHDHSFRHGLATAMADQESPIDMIANILGHTNINTTRRYIHRKTEDVADNMLRALE